MGDWEAEDLTQHITALPATQQPRERIMSADKEVGGGTDYSGAVEWRSTSKSTQLSEKAKLLTVFRDSHVLSC